MSERKRSFWGWGWEDSFPDSATRTTMAGHAAGLLGFQPDADIQPPELDAIELAPARVTCPLPFVKGDAEGRIRHTYGRGYRDLIRGLYGDFSAAPDAVAHPASEQDVEQLLAWASDANVAVVPYGGGTSVVGGVECRGEGFAGVVTMDLKKLDRVLELDDVSGLARIQAGALGPGLEAQLADSGHTLRHYPQSFEFSTLGGWIATRAGGHFATLYTHIDELVASARMITPTGAWSSRRLPGSGAGPSPDRMVCGSEGTLGVITEAWMRVRRRPRWRSSASVSFTDFAAAVGATRAIAQAGLYPANCRLLDAREAMLNGVAMGANVLLLSFESAHHPVEHPLNTALQIALDHGGTCSEGAVHRDDGARTSGGGKAGQWRNQFVRGPYLQTALATQGVLVDTFETACTWAGFEALHSDVVRSVRGACKEVGGSAFLSMRFTHVYPDGPAPYYTFVTKAIPGRELEQWAAIKTAASEALDRNQATITHHHAVGRTHRPWYDRQRPAPFAAALKAAKQAVDPAGILNPGVLID